MAQLGNAEEGLRLADQAIALDPLNAVAYNRRAEALIYLRRYSQALEAGHRALAIAPERRTAHLWVGDAFLLLGQPAKAKAEYEALEADNPFRPARLAVLAARTGDRAGAERGIAEMKPRFGDASSYQYGEIYAQLGDGDHAFAEWDHAIVAMDGGLAYLRVDPFIDLIRRDPRYAALLKRLNFPS